MISWLRRFNVTTRIMSLVIFLVVVMVAEIAFFMVELKTLKNSSYMQQEKVTESSQWLLEVEHQFEIRNQTMQLQLQAQQIQKTFSDMLFWYFDGIVTEYYESLISAKTAADLLEQQLTALAVDGQTKSQINAILQSLQEYREIMDSAVGYYQQGKDNLGQSEVADANIETKIMNEQLLALTRSFQARLKQADAVVVTALDKTTGAGEIVKSLSVKASEQIEQVQKITWFTLLLTLPTTLGVAIIIIVSITRPLRKLKQQLTLIEENSDLTQMLSLEGDDEIREMSEATQKLLVKLRQTLENVGELARQLEDAANKGYQVSSDTHRISSDQQVQSESIAAAATELGASSEDISNTADQGLRLVEKVAEVASTGQSDVQATAENMHQLAEQFDAVETTVEELVKHGSDIANVLEVIRSIADQTNLLALNAAIEAARAGDQGRGFAVVADEVRTLALRTSESTNEIQAMVEALQQQSKTATSTLKANREQVNQSVQLSEQANVSLTRIIDELDELSEANKVIATITNEQQKAVLEVDENVQKVLVLAVHVEEHARDSTGVSESLKELAEKLQQQLTKFRH
ncbi:MAG: methyl-accepting chemotaxis protein [Oceanospirillaceae bacterium]|nr:methyl-accepting chemotaxis protein [Oceanospirillaceae bacterium]